MKKFLHGSSSILHATMMPNRDIRREEFVLAKVLGGWQSVNILDLLRIRPRKICRQVGSTGPKPLQFVAI